MDITDSFNERFLKPTTLVELLRYTVDKHSDKLAYTFLAEGEQPQQRFTYAQLEQRARSIAAKLQSEYAAGDRALLLYPAGLEFVAGFLGCVYAGLIAIPAYPPRRNRADARLQVIAADAQATVILSSSEICAKQAQILTYAPELNRLPWVATDHIAEHWAIQWRAFPHITSNTLAFLQYTSGSTGNPKGVMVSHGNLLHNLAQFDIPEAQHSQDSVMVTWLPAFHDMGLIYGILLPLYKNFPCYLLPPASFLQQPMRWLQAISNYRGTHSVAPNFAYDLCTRRITAAQRAQLDLHSWIVAASGAEPIRAETLQKFATTFATCGFDPRALHTAYGLAEATLKVTSGHYAPSSSCLALEKSALAAHKVVIADPDTATQSHLAQTVVSCGRSALNTQVTIVNHATLAPCAINQIGEIWVSGGAVTHGYWNHPQETANTFQAYLAAGEGPFLRTGDLGFLHKGELFVTGRLKDIIIIRGLNFYPQDIELTVAQAHPALRVNSGAAFAITVAGEERLVVVHEVEKSALKQLPTADIFAAMRQAVSEQHDVQLAAIALLKPASIPKTTSGKIQRHACRARYLAEDLATVAHWAITALTADADSSATQAAISRPRPVSAPPAADRPVNSNPTAAEPRPAASSAASAVPPVENRARSTNADAAGIPATQARIETWLVAKIATQLNISPDELDSQMPLAHYGLDSATAINISGELETWLQRRFPPTLLYDYPSLHSLSQYLAEATDFNPAAPSQIATTTEAIAIIGLSCRFPNADNPQAFWQLLSTGQDAICKVPDSRWDIEAFYDPTLSQPGTMNTQWGGFLADVTQFDPQFFGISPLEAQKMDPQQRLCLEVSWEALENAGIVPTELAGSQTGVFIGICTDDYAALQRGNNIPLDAYSGTGNAACMVANRLSYLWDLHGPSLAINTACSSSLVAVHQACQSLHSGECELALVGGVNLILAPDLTVTFSQAGMMAADGHCKTFDARADGYVRGEGCGIVVLKPLAAAQRDQDNILAVIKGSGVNQDGRTNGLTAPNSLSQQQLIRQVLQQAEVTPAAVSYIEAHGTGTSLGDPIEMNALKEVLLEQRQPDQPCWIGSVKTNIGHLEAAAGVAGLIKVVLSLREQTIVPHLHLQQLNPLIELDNTPLQIATVLQAWPAPVLETAAAAATASPRIAGVSSFGFGGTNAHVIVAEAPALTEMSSTATVAAEVSTVIASSSATAECTSLTPPAQHLFTLSAKTPAALRELVQQYATYLQAQPHTPLDALCYSVNCGRSHFEYRLAVVAASSAALATQLEALLAVDMADWSQQPPTVQYAKASRTPPRVAFLFTGQGSQYVAMGQQLYASQPLFRAILQECAALLQPHLQHSLLDLLYPSTAEEAAATQLNETRYTQPALFALEYALAKLWQAWGIHPDVVMGHSIGEYVAACVAGVFSLADGLKLVAERARLMDGLTERGQMQVVFAPAERVAPLLAPYADRVAIAAYNEPNNVVIAGATATLQTLTQCLAAQGLETHPLSVSHAFHSPLMEPILDELAAVASSIPLHKPQIPLVSNVTGQVFDTTPNAQYWRAHTRQPVNFMAGINTLMQLGYQYCLEVGPKPVLTQLGKNCQPEPLTTHCLPSLRPQQPDWQVMLSSLARFYVQGAQLNWQALHAGHPQRRLHDLPTYPFQRQHCWLPTASQIWQPPPRESAHAAALNHPPDSKTALMHAVLAKLVNVTAELLQMPPAELDTDKSLLEMGADSLVIGQAVRKIESLFAVNFSIRQLFEDLNTLDALALYIVEHAAPATLIAYQSELSPLQPQGQTATSEGHTTPDTAQSSAFGTRGAAAVEANSEDESSLNPAGTTPLEMTPTQPHLDRSTETTGFTSAAKLPATTQHVAQQPAQLQPSVPQVEPVPHPAQPANDSVLGQVISQQLQVMTHQLEALCRACGNANNAELNKGTTEVTHEVARDVTHEAAQPTARIEVPTTAKVLPAAPTTAETDTNPVKPAFNTLPATPAAATTAITTNTAKNAIKSASPTVAFPHPATLSKVSQQASTLTLQQQQHLTDLITRYTQRTAHSKQLTQEYRASLADSRAAAGFRRSIKEMVYPIFAKGAQGCKTWDIDDNEYIDITMGFGVNLFGHNPAFIVAALEQQLHQTMQLGLQTPLAGQVAELICELTGLERVAFCNTGTEAVMTALRLARAATHRDKIVQFALSYHGHFDSTLGTPVEPECESAANSTHALTLPAAPGVTANHVADTWILEYGNFAALDQIRAYADQIAGVLVEPVQSRRPDLQPREFLHALRRLTLELDIPLIFDEMITGFRIHSGGAQAWFDIRADIATYGKIVGGGMPIGVIAGQARYLDGIDGGFWRYGDDSYPQADTTFFAGTFGKHPLTMATSLAVLQEIKRQGPSLQQQLNQRTTVLANTLNDYFIAEEMPIRIAHFGSLFRFSYSRNLDLLFYHLLEQGLYIWEGRNCFLSTAHSEADIATIMQAIQTSVEALRAGGFIPPKAKAQTGAGVSPIIRGSALKGGLSLTPEASPTTGETPLKGLFPLTSKANPTAEAPLLKEGLPLNSPQTSAIEYSLPLNAAQQQLWALSQVGGKEAALAYHTSLCITLSGAVNLTALQEALQHLMQRHSALRTIISADGDAQHCLPTLSVPVHYIDLLQPQPDPAAELNLTRFFEQDSHTPFELTQGPLLRATVLKLAEQQFLLVLTAHHLIVDGISFSIIANDLAEYYSAYCQNTSYTLPSTLSFQDYLNWQTAQCQTSAWQTQRDYWRQQFTTGIPVLNLPTDRPYPKQRSYRGQKLSMTLTATLSHDLKVFSQQQDCTLFMTLLAAYQIWLHRVTGQSTILVGIPAAGRGLAGSEAVVGYCTHLLPIQTEMSGDETCIAYLHRLRDILLTAYEHQDYPFAELLNDLQLTRDTSHTPLVAVTFNLDKPATLPEFAGLTASGYSQPIAFSPFDLSLNWLALDDGLTLEWIYNTDIFTETSIKRFLGQMQMLLTAMAKQPSQTLAQLPLLTAAEQQQLQAWNQTDTAYPHTKTLMALFAEHVVHTPNALAVSLAGSEAALTYAQLNQQANQLAQHLIELGVTADTLVGICVERSLHMVVGLVGILKAGGAYVPLDPTYPEHRLATMLADSQVPVLLTQRHLLTRLPVLQAGSTLAAAPAAATEGARTPETKPDTPASATPPCHPHLLCLEDWLDPTLNSSAATVTADFSALPNPPLRSQPQHLAYVIYTSGSTGQPKGVCIPQRAVVRLVKGTDYAQFNPEQRVLQYSSMCFDVATLEIWGALLHGAQLVVMPPQEPTLEALAAVLTQERISLLCLTTGVFNVLLEEYPTSLRNVAQVFVGGEALSVSHVQQAQHLLPNTQVINGYGPTENTTLTTCHSIDHHANYRHSIPIGKPLANTQVFIVDAHHNPLPIGCVGELVTTGAGLARGYLHRPELTAEKFRDLQLFGVTQRVYKTGDLARWLPDGNLDFVGRLDQQIKLRGFRIELGEIETVLSQHPAIKSAVVLRDDTAGTAALIAYVTQHPADASPASASPVDAQTLRDYLLTRLPAYMCPATIMRLDAFPLTPNGKIDRHALPSPTTADLTPSRQLTRPATVLEQQLSDIWTSVLNRESLSIHDNFLAVGGDSIIAIQIVARARQAGLAFSPRDLFQHPTIAALAQVVQPVAQHQAEQGPVQGVVPLTPIQSWCLARDTAEPWYFNQAVLLTVPAQLDFTALQHACAALLTHHDALRLRYRQVDGQWQQAHAETVTDVPLQVDSITGGNLAAALTTHCSHWQASLDLSHGPVTRWVLFQHPGGQRLLWVCHHLVVDGVSWRILLADLQTAYQQACAGQPIQLPAKTSSFKAWSEHLQAWGRSADCQAAAAYWQTADETTSVALPVDNPHGGNANAASRDCTMTLSATATSQLLTQTPVAYRSGINDILVSALLLALHEWNGQSAHTIALESHGRSDLFAALDLTRTVGWFTSVYSVALTLPAQPDDLARVIKAVKTQLHQVPQAGLAYGVLQQQGRSLPSAPILFNYLGQVDAPFDALSLSQDFQLAPEASGRDHSLTGQRDYQLEINALSLNGQLRVTFSYSGEQYHPATMEQLLARYQHHLQALIDHCATHSGYTPSDFPLADLTQTQLDTLAAYYGNTLDAIYPLSPLQQGLLFHTLYQPAVQWYGLQFHCRLVGPLHAGHLQQAWQTLLDRHAILRTAFYAEPLVAQDPALTATTPNSVEPVVSYPSTPLQIVRQTAVLPWQYHDWQHLTLEQQHTRLCALLDQEQQRGFDLTQAPLLRLHLIQEAEHVHRLVWHLHHILLDGWCLSILFEELFSLYTALQQAQPPQLPPVTPYQTYIGWLAAQDIAAAQDYWQQKLAGFTAPTELPVARGSQMPTEPSDSKVATRPHHAAVHLELTALDTAALKQLAADQHVTLSTVLQAAWAILLGRYSGTNDVVFGVTTSGRNIPLAGIDRMVGLFINSLPLRAQLTAQLPTLLNHLQTQQQQDDHYAYTPLVDIQAWSEVPNDQALFDSLVVFENYPIALPLREQQDLPLAINDVQLSEHTHYLYTLIIVPNDCLHLTLSFDTTRCDEATGEQLLQHLQQLLREMVKAPQTAVAEFSLLTAAEQQQLQAWNTTAVAYPPTMTVTELFTEQVAATPNHCAVVFGEQRLSYQQLEQRANQLANLLIAHDMSANQLVGVCVERSIEMVIGVLAILKAGGAYVPLDPDYPSQRLQWMLEDSQVRLILTQRHLADRLPTAAATYVYLDDPALSQFTTDIAPSVRNQATDLAYVLFTSGSTGRPKGVAMPHCALLNLLHWHRQQPALATPATTLQFASLNFDVSFQELFSTWSTGGTLVLIDDLTRRDMPALLNTLVMQQVQRLYLPFVALQQLAETAGADLDRWATQLHLTDIITAGEQLKMLPALTQLLQRTGCRLHNHYGPTESHVVTSYQLPPAPQPWPTLPPIGRPIANCQIYILDAQQQPQPLGVAGELYIGGAGLAHGYYGREDLTAEKFLHLTVFGTRQRLYKTGDLARWLPSGELEYLGRLDQQVKIRGFRVELGEIEAVLARHEAVKQAVVVQTATEPPSLAAYLTLVDLVAHADPAKTAATLDALRAELRAHLPDYMQPSYFTLLETLPVTPNGKVNRRALPAPAQHHVTAQHVVPRNATELQLVQIWQSVLQRQPISIHANFFELGGHSLLAVKLISHIHQHFQQQLPLAVLFQHPTVAALAAHLQTVAQAASIPYMVPIQPRGDLTPLYVLPGAGGEVLYFQPLAAHLGEAQPVYGLEAPGLHGAERPPTSVEAHATALRQSLQQQQPSGPYRLAGHSAGARIAFELAYQLEQQGHTVQQLIVLDMTAPAPEVPPVADEVADLCGALGVLADLYGVDLGITHDTLAALPDAEQRYAFIMQRLQALGILYAPGTPVAALRRLFEVHRTMRHNHAVYAPTGVVHCPIVVVQAAEVVAAGEHRELPVDWGWQAFTAQPVTVVQTPGAHISILTEPHVRDLAALLQQV